jgi:outer membrane murein-binding lipoprotein Lpp
VDLDEVADGLYSVPPGEFIAARREREQQARADGDRSLASAIGSLPKPSTAAWVCNVLVRAERQEIESLVQLGDLLRDAQRSLAGDQLRALNAQRSQLLGALTRQASALARTLGHPISTSVEGQVEDTLRAALADPEAGEALLSGRLTSPLSYSGLGDVRGSVARPTLRVVPPPAERPARPARRTAEDRERRDEDRREQARRREEEERRAAEAQRQRQLQEARDAVDEATAAAREAIAAARVEQAHVEEFGARQEQLQARLDQLSTEVAHVREQLNAAGADLGKAQRRLHTAERRRTEATAARDAALARLDELSAAHD